MRTARQILSPPRFLQMVALAALLLAGIAPPGHAQADKPALVAYQSADEAIRAIDKAAADAVRAEEDYRAEKRACYRKFLTTACLDAATSRRRATLSALRSIEVGAKSWLRKDRADRRDQALAQRRMEDERDTREREGEVKAREAAIERKRLASEERQRQAPPPAAAVPDTEAQRLKSEPRLRERTPLPAPQ
ncbi:hypothetical protein [Lacisediminimonas sp.]|uniref:hypothetical protein n=1 Tax=Lacisediminimonas sp. TaxID=3060582 RepID=UPI00271E0657|nr:hypothetical protein [Lacisediminimonas sp.]MDO8301272.1 hypothetical protein [Lacisediminimonas sp.]